MGIEPGQAVAFEDSPAGAGPSVGSAVTLGSRSAAADAPGLDSAGSGSSPATNAATITATTRVIVARTTAAQPQPRHP